MRGSLVWWGVYIVWCNDRRRELGQVCFGCLFANAERGPRATLDRLISPPYRGRGCGVAAPPRSMR